MLSEQISYKKFGLNQSLNPKRFAIVIGERNFRGVIVMDVKKRNSGFSNIVSSSRNPSFIRRARGATLIEVLVSIAVTSIGLLGMAGLLAISSRVNQLAYQRTQAGFAAQALIESMHVNPAGVMQNRYDETSSFGGKSLLDCHKNGCSASERADYDRLRFHNALVDALPNATSSLKCNRATSSTTFSDGYDGLCRLQIDWSDRPLSEKSEVQPQSLVWVFQP